MVYCVAFYIFKIFVRNTAIKQRTVQFFVHCKREKLDRRMENRNILYTKLFI